MNQKLNLHYIRVITPKGEKSGESHLCGLAPGQHPLKNVAAVANRWRHCVRFDRPGNSSPNMSDEIGRTRRFSGVIGRSFLGEKDHENC